MYINYKTPFSNFHSSKSQPQGFPGSPVAKILGSQCREHGLSPGQGTKIPHATTGIRKLKKKKKITSASLYPFADDLRSYKVYKKL